jgi:DNA processing protein
MSSLPPQAYAAALAAFDRMTAPRLRVLLSRSSPQEAFETASGQAPPTGLTRRLLDTPGLAAAWAHSATVHTPERVWSRCVELRIDVLVHGLDGYPDVLLHDPAPAPVLFVSGSFGRLAGRRVGIVGTRNATAAGRDTAGRLGRDLAAQGVHVVSGLARGIDGCAHRGALSVDDGAAPVAVVAAGLDVVYPPEHGLLFARVAERGVVVSEAPPGAPPEAYRFPLRNRIIAALSEVLVVVESRERGGSLITVDEARRRGVTVMAVPGSVHNRAANGTNDLVRDGCPIVTGAADVLTALGLDTSRAGGSAYDPRPRPSGLDLVLLDLCAEARTLEQFVLLTGESLVDCAMSVGRLELTGWIQQVNGWFERAPSDAFLR